MAFHRRDDNALQKLPLHNSSTLQPVLDIFWEKDMLGPRQKVSQAL